MKARKAGNILQAIPNCRLLENPAKWPVDGFDLIQIKMILIATLRLVYFTSIFDDIYIW